jgi:hypothetical protein
MHIILVGASHGWRLHEALKTISGYGTTFTVTCLCVRGATFYRLQWPTSVKNDDVLVVILFGNDIQPKSHLEFDKKSRKIHLLKFIPYDKKYWDNLFNALTEKLANRNCTILMIDNFYCHFLL